MSTLSIRHNAIFMPLFFLGGFLIGQIETGEQQGPICHTESYVQNRTASVSITPKQENERQANSEKLRTNLVAGKEVVAI